MISGLFFCLEKISYAIAEENKFSYCTQKQIFLKTQYIQQSKSLKINPNHQIIEIVFWTLKNILKNYLFCTKKIALFS